VIAPVAAAILALVTQGAPAGSSERLAPVVVASKPFGESYLLAEIFARLLEARGLRVDRRPGLGATDLAFSALQSGAIDVYPEYTGTGLLAILHETPSASGGAGDAYRRVSAEFRRRWGIRWLAPLGFENGYAISVRRPTADSLHLESLSDLARHAGVLRAGLTADFIGRADGLVGLQRAYDLHFREVRPLGPAIKYQALAAGQVDVIDGYSTDGLIAKYDLKVLRDDRRFFPPYEAAPLVGARLAATNPRAIAALEELGGLLDVARMRALNERVEVAGEPVASVARDALAELGLVGSAGGPTKRSPSDEHASFLSYLADQRATIARLALRHIELVAASLFVAVLLAVPVGLALERVAGRAEAVIRGVGVLQTLPGIALLAFMIPLLGIGVVPALAALVLYSLYPIMRNTFTGVRDADPAAVASARALGMTDLQILRDVRLPLAAPIIMAGIRTAAVVDVGTATLAAFIGAGGLGEPIVAGLALSDTRMILSGAIPAALLALGVDALLAGVERLVKPGGLA
jgi:osmoprotectant transport system permease protein